MVAVLPRMSRDSCEPKQFPQEWLRRLRERRTILKNMRGACKNRGSACKHLCRDSLELDCCFHVNKVKQDFAEAPTVPLKVSQALLACSSFVNSCPACAMLWPELLKKCVACIHENWDEEHTLVLQTCYIFQNVILVFETFE